MPFPNARTIRRRCRGASGGRTLLAGLAGPAKLRVGGRPALAHAGPPVPDRGAARRPSVVPGSRTADATSTPAEETRSCSVRFATPDCLALAGVRPRPPRRPRRQAPAARPKPAGDFALPGRGPAPGRSSPPSPGRSRSRSGSSRSATTPSPGPSRIAGSSARRSSRSRRPWPTTPSRSPVLRRLSRINFALGREDAGGRATPRVLAGRPRRHRDARSCWSDHYRNDPAAARGPAQGGRPRTPSSTRTPSGPSTSSTSWARSTRRSLQFDKAAEALRQGRRGPRREVERPALARPTSAGSSATTRPRPTSGSAGSSSRPRSPTWPSRRSSAAWSTTPTSPCSCSSSPQTYLEGRQGRRGAGDRRAVPQARSPGARDLRPARQDPRPR